MTSIVEVDARIYESKNGNHPPELTLSSTLYGHELPHYTRPFEEAATPHFDETLFIPYRRTTDTLHGSELSAGSQNLLKGILHHGTTMMFEGGGAGVQYDVLKGAFHPDIVKKHAQEAAAYFHTHNVNLLLAPGNSGHPFGVAYSYASDIPVILMDKTKYDPDATYPSWAIVMPGYSSGGEDVHSANPKKVKQAVFSMLQQQLAFQANRNEVNLRLNFAVVDDIFDKATMAIAIGDSSTKMGHAAIRDFIHEEMRVHGDYRTVIGRAGPTAMAAPMIKGYTGGVERMREKGIEPFGGIDITAVYVTPHAIGVEGVGIVEFNPNN